MHIDVSISPTVDGRWAVMAYLINDEGLTIDGAGTLEDSGLPYDSNLPTTWEEVTGRVIALLNDAQERGFPVRLRKAHDEMLRKTKGE